MAKKAKKEVFEKAIVEKRNVLNEIRNNNMTLQEMRLFSIYLSKINARDLSTRVVSFPLEDFQKIMKIGSDMNIPHFKATIRKILQEIVEVPNEDGNGYTAFQLFKKAIVRKNDEGYWIVAFEAHDDALPLMFNFKSHYFKYELWNALRLKSSNQIRMYEILKQYETIGHRELTIAELRGLLGVEKDEYSGRTGWSDFKRKVLDSCQQALKENTDICFTYEKGRSGRGGAWLSIIFHIFKNTEYVDQLTLSEFIDLQAVGSDEEYLTECNMEETVDVAYVPQNDLVVVKDEDQITFDESNHNESEEDHEDKMIAKYGSEYMARLASSVDYSFTPVQVTRIASILSTKDDIPPDYNTKDILWQNALYLKRAYSKFRVTEEEKQNRGEHIKNRFAYFEIMLENYKEQ